MSNASKSPIKRVAMLFSGGPAPAANAVISTAAAAFVRDKIEVFGIKNGYTHLVKFVPGKSDPLTADDHYIVLDEDRLRRTRNSPGIMIGTARANPGKKIECPDDLKDSEKCAGLRSVYDALCSMKIDALVSIGGDDTLRTAYKFLKFQETLPASARKIPIVHLPKTIDNDYFGIDFTFGYNTAVDTMAGEIRNLLADAEAGRAYFIVESMGRGAGWLAYGAAIAGEASHVMSIEDLDDDMKTTEQVLNKLTQQMETRPIMKVDDLVERIVALMLRREKNKKEFGVVVLAEGLAEFYPLNVGGNREPPIEVKYDEFGHISSSSVDFGKRMAKRVARRYAEVTGGDRKVNGVQLGYETRCARPIAYDVMLGSQLGVGAYRALVEQGKNGVMVSVEGQFQLKYVPFKELVNQKTLTTKVRLIDKKNDFWQLARFLESPISSEDIAEVEQRKSETDRRKAESDRRKSDAPQGKDGVDRRKEDRRKEIRRKS